MDSHHIQQAVKEYTSYLNARNLSQKTIQVKLSALDNFTSYIQHTKNKADIRTITSSDISDYATLLKSKRKRTKQQQAEQQLSVSYKNSLLRAVKKFFGFLAAMDYILYDITSNIPLFPTEKRIPRNILSEKEMFRLFAAIGEGTLTTRRDLCIFKLLYNTGMRKGELEKLEIRDIYFEDSAILIREGKGNKDRLIPMGNNMNCQLREYITDVRPHFTSKNPATQLLFTTNQGKQFSKNLISSLVKQYTKKAGIHKDITAHSIRHSFATHLLQRGASIRHIQEILGHEELTTTEIYTRVAIKDLKEVYKKHHPREINQ